MTAQSDMVTIMTNKNMSQTDTDVRCDWPVSSHYLPSLSVFQLPSHQQRFTAPPGGTLGCPRPGSICNPPQNHLSWFLSTLRSSDSTPSSLLMILTLPLRLRPATRWRILIRRRLRESNPPFFSREPWLQILRC